MPRRRSQSRAGKPFEAEVRKSLKAFGNKHSDFWYHRLSDTMAYIQIPNVYLPKQPGDFIALYKGLFYLLEAKSLRTTSFPMIHLRDHQRKGLLAIEKCGGRGYLLMSFRRKRPIKCYAVRIQDFVRIEREAKSKKRKSVSQAAVKKRSITLPRIPMLGWDLTPLFDSK